MASDNTVFMTDAEVNLAIAIIIQAMPPGADLIKAMEIGLSLQGITLEEMADTLGITPAYVRMVARGERSGRRASRWLQLLREFCAPCEVSHEQQAKNPSPPYGAPTGVSRGKSRRVLESA